MVDGVQQQSTTDAEREEVHGVLGGPQKVRAGRGREGSGTQGT